MAISHLIRRRFRHLFLPSKPPSPFTIVVIRHISSPSAATPPPSAQPEPKLSLSSRLSFVFDQIDALERQRDTSAKNEALQRIRSWSQAKQPPPPPPLTHIPPVSTSNAPAVANRGTKGSQEIDAKLFQREVEVVHPWPEWIELMERLGNQNYFDYRRVEEKRVASKAGIDLSVVKQMGFDLTRDWAAVRTACMNFGRDRFDILKSLSRKDIQTLVGHGCPNMSPKVVFSAKLLRKYVRLDEGDVCSSCSLRSTCSRGYILVPKEDEARTLDVMRILLTYGFDHVKKTLDNDDLRKMKPVKTVIRKLLHEIVKLSAVPRDPNLLPPVIKKPPPKVKQPPTQPKRRVGRDDIEMKKGDWLCSKCNFMNFAKNTVCLQCDAKRPKRQLLPGEWECPKCNFLNYRRNMSCFQCEHTRPPDEFTENQKQGQQMAQNTRLERSTRAKDVSNAWNFDFDDDESDGADVAAFEFADSSKAQNGSNLDEPPQGGTTRGFGDDIQQQQDRRRYFSNPSKGNSSSNSHATGFDDFDDEEEDSVDNYELDETNGNETQGISRKNLSEFESSSESEDFDDHDNYSKRSQHRKEHLSDSDDDFVDSAPKSSSRSFDSSDDMELHSDSEHGKYDLKKKEGLQKAGQKGFTRRKDSDFDDDLISDFDDDDLHSSRSKKKVAGGSERTGRNFQEPYRVGSTNNRRNFIGNDENLYSRGSREKGKSGKFESKERRFQDSTRFGSKNVGKASFGRHDGEEFDQGRSDFRRSRANQSNGGARGFQKSRSGSEGNGYGRRRDDHGMADHSKGNYRQHERNNHNNRRSRNFNDDNDVSDNKQRRRIIER